MAQEPQSHSRDLGVLAAELVEAIPPLEEPDQRVALAVYRLLAEGESVLPLRIAERVGALLDSWPGVYRDSEGRVIGFWGLALGEMPHRLQVDGRTLYGWCAWDTLFLPVILGREARFRSEEAGREWTATHSNTFLLARFDGFEVGRRTSETKFGAA